MKSPCCRSAGQDDVRTLHVALSGSLATIDSLNTSINCRVRKAACLDVLESDSAMHNLRMPFDGLNHLLAEYNGLLIELPLLIGAQPLEVLMALDFVQVGRIADSLCHIGNVVMAARHQFAGLLCKHRKFELPVKRCGSR